MSLSTTRIELHEKARNLLHTGQYQKAAGVLQDTVRQHGSHVGLLCDLIAAEYMQGKTDAWILTLQRLSLELEDCKAFLSPSSSGKTFLFLGKMNEELGEVHTALQYFQRASEVLNVNREIKLNAYSQILRLKSYLGFSKGLSSLYQLTAHSYLESEFHQVEIEHGLLLAELALFGPGTAADRLKKLWSHKGLVESDRRLVLIDFIEYLFRRRVNIDPKTLGLARGLSISNFDTYEKFLYDLLILQSMPQPEMRKLSPFGLLKCLSLMVGSDKYAVKQEELSKRIFFHLNSLSHESRSLLISFFKLEESLQNVQLNWDEERGLLKAGSDVLTMKSNSFASRCLSLLTDDSTIPTDSFINKIFNESELTLSSLEKTRIAIQRLNSELRVRFGIPKAIEFSKQTVNLNSNVRLMKSKSES